MRVLFIVAVLLGGLFAGCVSASGSKEAPSSSAAGPIGPGDIDPNSPNGVVQGTIVSEEGAPVARAQVALQNTTFAGTTDDKGFFIFREVPPGKYVLLVGALGYKSTGRSVEVQAGQITPVSLIVQAIEVQSLVYPEVHPFVGYYDCALATAAWISSCSWPYTAVVGGLKDGWCTFFVIVCTPAPGINATQYGVPKDVQNNVFRFNISIKQNIGQYVGEVQWDPSSAASTKMNLLVACGDYDPLADDCKIGLRYGSQNGVAGKSPIKNSILVNDKYGFKNQAKANNTKWDLNTHDSIWIMSYVGLPFASATDPTTNQVAFQQKFNLWVTIFYNGAGPEDYSVIPPS